MRSIQEENLLDLIEAIQRELAQDGRDTAYPGLSKSLNILKNKDRNGYGKLKHHLLSDFRRLYDNRHDNDALNRQFESACQLAEQIVSSKG
ncbi:hypothetical protein PsAD2_02590 [Pseudovibrio axinellae]|uniref:Uncharacterized protein n=1 Tax=Pseudovibrio axinellae TaxID=989403 RepID=A0A165Y996_9HYPH|nr:hypothetical protein PsAD2_02590 [Pseudovibrio axinellae]SER95237.1 hypothetical protein SAMN05421798_1801 [Pseudovibrio axinellae]